MFSGLAGFELAVYTVAALTTAPSQLKTGGVISGDGDGGGGGSDGAGGEGDGEATDDGDGETAEH